MQDKKIQLALSRPGSLSFDGNEAAAQSILDRLPQLNITKLDGASYWHEGDKPGVAGTRVKIYSTGHMAFYNNDGRRFLGTDPNGNPLHEAKWSTDSATGETHLELARMQLDCKQWVGIKPRARTFSTQIDISSQQGWENLSLDDLREKAAEVWRVPFSEVKYFYKDENLVHVGEGKYDISLTKDGLYALIDGSFDRTLFISFMFCVNWARLDLIPVVELFQSTLPGAGGAVFEFIWGLYEDQSREDTLDSLRYRGLPTYPSSAAFNIFSAFFTPQAPEGEDDITKLFMDPNRSHEVIWTPSPTPPWRYFSDTHKICLTVQDGFLYKVTDLEDTVPIPFINCSRGARPSIQRHVQVGSQTLILINDDVGREIPFDPNWNITPDTSVPKKLPPQSFGWKWFFNGFPPTVDPVKAIYTVPFYPEGDAEIDESALQPLALDQMIYYMEMSPAMAGKLEKIDKVLIHTLDMVIAGCIDCTKERQYTVLFSDPELAQKNACQLWDYAVSRNQLDNLKKVSFLPEQENLEEVYKEKYGMIFKWIPMMYYQDRETCQWIMQSLADALLPEGMLFLAGPRPIQGLFSHFGLESLYNDPIMNMPFFRQHLKMCPENLVNPEATVFLIEKSPEMKPTEIKIPDQTVSRSTPAEQKPETSTDEPEITIRDFSRDN